MTTAKVAGTASVTGIVSKRGSKLTCPKKGARKKYGNKTYTVKGNHRLKTDATKSANAARKTGKNARIVKTATCGYTVLVSGTAKKKTTAKKSTTKKRTTKKRTYNVSASRSSARGWSA